MLNISSKLNNVYPQNEKFIKISCKITDPQIFYNLSPLSCKLYLLLRSYSDGNHKPVFPSIPTLMKRMNVSKDTIIRAIKELEDLNLIQVKKKTGKCNQYHFIDHSPRTQATTNPSQPCDPNNNKFSNQIQKTTTTNHRVDVVPLVKEHKKKLTQLKNPPKVDILSDYYQNHLAQTYDPRLVELIIHYTTWVHRCEKTRIHNLKGFIKWLLNKPYEVDYGDYFEYLQRLINKEKRKEQNQNEVEIAKEEGEYLTPAEMETFFDQMKAVVGGK